MRVLIADAIILLAGPSRRRRSLSEACAAGGIEDSRNSRHLRKLIFVVTQPTASRPLKNDPIEQMTWS